MELACSVKVEDGVERPRMSETCTMIVSLGFLLTGPVKEKLIVNQRVVRAELHDMLVSPCLRNVSTFFFACYLS